MVDGQENRGGEIVFYPGLCVPGKAIATVTVFLNPFIIPLAVLYYKNYKKLKKVEKEVLKAEKKLGIEQAQEKFNNSLGRREYNLRKEFSTQLIIAMSLTHTAISLIANGIATFAVAHFFMGADKKVSAGIALALITFLMFLSCAWGYAKYSFPMQDPEESNGNSKEHNKHGYVFFMHAALISSGPLFGIILLPIGFVAALVVTGVESCCAICKAVWPDKNKEQEDNTKIEVDNNAQMKDQEKCCYKLC